MFLTCLPGWRKLICVADNLMHELHIPWKWLCDLHDREITGEN